MRTFDLINMSDKVTYLAPDLEIGAIVAFLLGEGRYGARTVDDGELLDVPIFLFGGSEEWCKAQLGCDIEALFHVRLEARKAEVADAMRSALYADADERVALDELRSRMPDDEWAAFRAKHQDGRRTSMNNICGRADHYAKKFSTKGAS